ncbi:hypothetical protein GCM10017687_44870 [Streptomyces echinatus]
MALTVETRLAEDGTELRRTVIGATEGYSCTAADTGGKWSHKEAAQRIVQAADASDRVSRCGRDDSAAACVRRAGR